MKIELELDSETRDALCAIKPRVNLNELPHRKQLRAKSKRSVIVALLVAIFLASLFI